MFGPTKWHAWLRARTKDTGHSDADDFGTRPGDIVLPGLGALTGQDKRVLEAIAACWQLYACSDYNGERAALDAIRSLLRGMQQQCWPFARELIAWALDWHDRDRLWKLVQPHDLTDELDALDAVTAAARKT